MKLQFHELSNSKIITLLAIGTFVFVAIIVAFGIQSSLNTTRTTLSAKERKLAQLKSDLESTRKTLGQKDIEISKLTSEDQFVRNNTLQTEIKNIESTFQKAYKTYESLLKLKDKNKTPPSLDQLFAQVLNQLSQRNYSSASSTLDTLNRDIKSHEQKVVAEFKIPESVKANNTPPGQGYSRQKVSTPVGEYMVDIVSADLSSTKVIVDTASDGTCTSNCPVMSLSSYASRSGAFAAINGPYFCPASYPSCTGKENSFDTLLMNKNKVYFNSDNNVYSTVPAIIFSGGSGRIVGKSLEWGRDTGVDSVIASQPMLTSNGSRVFGGDGEVKRQGKGSRSFIGFSGTTVYIGVVYSASVAEVAYVMETLGVQNSLNLDSGGSTALLSGGRYLAGPGRDLPFGIVLVRR